MSLISLKIGSFLHKVGEGSTNRAYTIEKLPDKTLQQIDLLSISKN